ncbi:hypothetical protein [Novosphingobium sp. 9]|uniref:hypothetical protein n=1 Tax=Novosphingobium sp. 9 TaxID=2025349 RepID=UPI0021B569D8|nr:hypothetical protein [Novosphingobium sp. 9]
MKHAALIASLAALALAPALSGCIAKTAVNVVTLPVKAGSKAVDWTTTSQSESDRNRGRKMRKQEEQIGKLQKQYDRHMKQCNQGDERACQTARDDYAQIQGLRTQYPS